MSELLTLQDLANGHLDVKALGEAANGDENTIVTTRTGNTYPSAKKAISEGITNLFENGGLPATPFATKALMTASALIDGKYAQVTDDTVNNGLYVKTAGAWVKSLYDPLVNAKTYTDASVSALSYQQICPVISARYRATYTAEAIASKLIEDRISVDWVIDTVAMLIYIPATMTVFDAKGVVYTSGVAQNLVIPEKLSGRWHFLKMFYDKSTSSFTLYNYDLALSDTQKANYILVAFIRLDFGGLTVITDSNFQIDCAKQGEVLVSETCQIFSGATAGKQNLPDYDSTNHTLTFGTNTTLKHGNYIFSIGISGLVVQCQNSAELSSAVDVFWDIASNSIIVKKYNTIIATTQRHRLIRVATIRDRGITGGQPGDAAEDVSIDVGINYTINGVNPFSNSGGLPIVTDGEIRNSIVRYSPPDTNIKAVNHRGWNSGVDGAPENTLPAYKLSKINGFKYVECDINWSSDNVPFLLHDETLDRTSGGTLTGLPSTKTMAQIKTGDFGAWKGSQWAGTRAPTLEEFLTFCNQANLHPYIEWTTSEATPEKITILLDVINRTAMRGKLTIISFSYVSLGNILNQDPTIRVGLNISSAASLVGRLDAYKAACEKGVNELFVNYNRSYISTEVMQTTREAGLYAECWVANTEADVVRIANFGVSGISTDNMKVQEVLDAHIMTY